MVECGTPTKVQQCMDLLNILPDPLRPGTKQIIKIAKQVGCHEQRAWIALRKLRKQKDFVSTNQLYLTLRSDLLFLYKLMIDKMVPKQKLSPQHLKRLNKIEGFLEVEEEQGKVDIVEAQDKVDQEE